MRLVFAALLIGLFLFLGSCASMRNEPPTTIYPNPREDPGAYPAGTIR